METKDIYLTNEGPPNLKTDEILTIDELATLLKCSTGLINKEKNKGSIPYLKIGNCVRFEKEKVLQIKRKNAEDKESE